jgi:hypothetical protein
MAGYGVLVAVTERCCYRVTCIVGFRLQQAPSSALSTRPRRRRRSHFYINFMTDVEQSQMYPGMKMIHLDVKGCLT